MRVGSYSRSLLCSPSLQEVPPLVECLPVGENSSPVKSTALIPRSSHWGLLDLITFTLQVLSSLLKHIFTVKHFRMASYFFFIWTCFFFHYLLLSYFSSDIISTSCARFYFTQGCTNTALTHSAFQCIPFLLCPLVAPIPPENMECRAHSSGMTGRFTSVHEQNAQGTDGAWGHISALVKKKEKYSPSLPVHLWSLESPEKDTQTHTHCI